MQAENVYHGFFLLFVFVKKFFLISDEHIYAVIFSRIMEQVAVLQDAKFGQF